MKTLTKFRFCLTRLVMLLICLWSLTPQATADVTIWVYGTTSTAPHLQYWNATATNVNSGEAMTSYEYQGTTWYYTVLEGVNSCSIIFDTDGHYAGQTDDITNVSGTKYYYYNGNGRYVDLTDVKGYNSFVFVDKYAGDSWWNNDGAVTRVHAWGNNSGTTWPGTALESTPVGKMNLGGNNIYVWKGDYTGLTGMKLNRCQDATSTNNPWNESSDNTYHKGGLYYPIAGSANCYQNVQIGNVAYPTSVPVADTYAVTGIASPTDGGTVTPASTADLVTGNTVTLTATPATGYTFSDWSVSGTTNYTENGNSITVTVESSNVTATANFTAIPNEYTIHVIEYYANQPYLYAWHSNGNLTSNFPGAQMTATETSAAGETWYKTTLSTTASTISAIASLGENTSQTADITGIAPGDYYIVFNGTTKEIIYQGTTMPEGKQQAEKNTFTLYARSTGSDDVLHAYVYGAPGEANGSWTDAIVAPLDTKVLADGLTWYKYTLNTLASSYSVVLYNGTDSKQTVNITDITDSVRYVVVLDDDLAENKYNVTYTTLPPTDKMYVIGKAGGNPWSTTNGLEMTKDTSTGKFTLNNVQIIAGADFAFAAALTGEDEWDKLNLRRLTSIGNPTYDLTESQLGQPLALRLHNGSDNNNFKILETAYYDISLDPVTLKVTITRKYGALYMFYGDSNSPYWKPNAGVPMFTTDGKTFMLTNVELDVDDTFQFATQLGADENTWPANTYRYGANSAGNNNWLVTESQIDVVLENALRAETGKDFQMGSGTAGTYRVMVNPEAKTVALYRMADVTGSKVIIHLEKTSNVTKPIIWAYDKERDLADSTYIHVDRPSRHEIATNRKRLMHGVQPDTIVTAGGRQWWTWELETAIADFWFTRNDFNYEAVMATVDQHTDMTDINWRRSGEIFLTWPSQGSTLEDYTRDYYAAAAQEAAECAVMIEGHHYAYFTNTPGWEHVFCHAWYTDDQGVNHDLLTPPSPYTGDPVYPGALCEMVGYDKDGYEVWRIDLTEAYTAAGVTSDSKVGILFNNGIDDNHVYEHDMNHDYFTGQGTTAAKEQSGDFTFSTGTCYDYCGVIVLGRSLSNIITKGVLNGPVYTIQEDIVGVWFDENAVTEIDVDGTTHRMYGALYCKDLNNFVTTPYVEKSIQKEGEIDYMLQRTSLMTGKNRYDQSNWVKLTLSTQYPNYEAYFKNNPDNQKAELRKFEGFVLPAESVRGQLVNNYNPEMRLALQALPESNTVNNYSQDPNVFVTANFIGTQDCTENPDEYGHQVRNTYFMVTPKPQEYAKITWAVYGTDGNFHVPQRGSYAFVDGKYEWMNEGDLNGYFPVKWDLQSNPGLVANQAYSFRAIIRLADQEQAASTGGTTTLRAAQDTVPYKPYSGTVKYVVSPIDLSTDDIITAVTDINATTKTVRQVRYYNLAGIESSEPFDGINVVVTTYTDGSKSTAKILK